MRFGKQDLDLLRRNLQIPDEIVCSQRSVCDGMEAMCILLKRLANPCRYTDMVPRFGRNPTELCLIFNELLDFIYTSHRHRLQNPFLQPDQLHRYEDAIHQQGAPLNNCFGFVDGTVREFLGINYLPKGLCEICFVDKILSFYLSNKTFSALPIL